MIRILHFSDVHVEVPFAELPKGELVSKRFIGLMNLWLRRGWRFREVVPKLEALARFYEQGNFDLVLASGDHTALGTGPELRRARQLLSPLIGAPLGFVTVPGNHDLYLGDTLRDDRFSFRFGDLMETDFPELTTHGAWPVVKRIGDDLAVVAVNSARPNPQPWRSSGRIPEAQLVGLARAVADERIRDRFIVVMTHYAPRRPDGTPDTFRHGLENWSAFEDACRGIRRGMVIHGHLHDCFHLGTAHVPGMPLQTFCAGSATDAKHNGFWVYEINGEQSRALRGGWAGAEYALDGTVVPLDVSLSGSL